MAALPRNLRRAVSTGLPDASEFSGSAAWSLPCVDVAIGHPPFNCLFGDWLLGFKQASTPNSQLLPTLPGEKPPAVAISLCPSNTSEL
jgi:hypothetical protein